MSSTHRLSRDCPATVIPAGQAITLPAGSEVTITQTLGGNVTVRADQGLLRIARENAGAIEGYVETPDDLGSAPTETGGGAGAFSEQEVWAALKTCFDPEIPVNIVDLGLVYDLSIEETPAEGDASSR